MFYQMTCKHRNSEPLKLFVAFVIAYSARLYHNDTAIDILQTNNHKQTKDAGTCKLIKYKPIQISVCNSFLLGKQIYD